MRDAEQFVDYGLRGLAPRVDFSGVLFSARRVVEEVHDKKRLRERPEATGVEVLDGAGDVRFADLHTVRVENGGPGGTEAEIRGDRFVIRAGGMPGGLASRAPSTPSPTATPGSWSRCQNRLRS